MPRFLRKIINFFIYSETLISICAIAATCQTYLLLQKSIIWDELLLVVGFSTMACYVLARLAALEEMNQMFRKAQNRTPLFHLLCALLFTTSIACFYLFWQLKTSIQIVLILSGVITVLYTLPLIPSKNGWKKLRDIGMLKIFLIAIIWTISTAILPILQCNASFENPRTWLIILEKLLFIFAITLPFDIRDMNYDEGRNLKTIPLLIGIENTLQLSYVCLAALGFIAVINYLLLPNEPQFFLMLGLLMSYRSTAILIQQTKVDRPDQFYTGFLDATILLQAILVVGFSTL
ncbi:MAG: UbiA family prenyltransferase [Chitinophagales bacterium]